MQTLTQIRQMLSEAGLTPHRRFGQNFLIDGNLMGKLLDLADVRPGAMVLEVGPGTGCLTEELLVRGARVVAVEIDRGFCRLLEERLSSQPQFRLICADVLVGKHAIEPLVLEALGPQADLVANLPYNVATPLVAQCMLDTWAALRRGRGTAFGRMTFTVQQEVAQRFTAGVGEAAYGPLSVVVSLLGRARLGPMAPASAFWPAPAVVSRMMQVTFDRRLAEQLVDAPTLTSALALVFGQRRKQISSVIRRKNAAFEQQTFAEAITEAGIDASLRAERVSPEQYRDLANALARRGASAQGAAVGG
jgi:16S rRNA (adenine1518-N6/adenine1519-N6)-dimethyltransferase